MAQKTWEWSPHPAVGFKGYNPGTQEFVTCVWKSDGNGGLLHPQFWQNGRLVDLPAVCSQGIDRLLGDRATPEEVLSFWRDHPQS